jgi:hypothetical protein
MSTGEWRLYVITAGQLRDMIAAVPDDTPVILAKDAEGNAHSPLSSVEATGYVYEPDTTYSGEVHQDPPDPEDADAYWPVDGTPVVLLGPVN